MAEENVESIDLTNILEDETNKFVWDVIPENLRNVRENQHYSNLCRRGSDGGQVAQVPPQ